MRLFIIALFVAISYAQTTTTGEASGGGSGGGNTVVVDYNPCYGRRCGMICNNCQMGELCPDLVHRCDSVGACVSTAFTCPNTHQRNPLMRVRCQQQSQANCYGLALDVNAEYDGVCGWSAQLGRCVTVSIGEEAEEGNMCAMHRTILECNGGATHGIGGFPIPVEGEPGEGVDRVCAWNPFTMTCKGGQLEQEAGDGAGFGMATYTVCNTYGTSPENCPAPYCSWTGSDCVPGVNTAEVQKVHKTPKQSKPNPWVLCAFSAGAFLVGLVASWLVVRICRSKASFSEPLALGPV